LSVFAVPGAYDRAITVFSPDGIGRGGKGLSVFAVPGAYDRAITVFSPDGRLFQVEYALETVYRGPTIIGITCPEGVVIGAEEKIESKLQDPNFSQKIYEVDEHQMHVY